MHYIIVKIFILESRKKTIDMAYGQVPTWQIDPDYYPKNDPRRKEHLKRIKEFLRIDRLVSMSGSDGSYSLTLRKD